MRRLSIAFLFICAILEAQKAPLITVGDSIVYVYSDDFEDWPLGTITTEYLRENRPVRTTQFGTQQYIINIGGNKVWRSTTRDGNAPNCNLRDGCSFYLNLGRVYDELYFTYKIYAPSDWDGTSLGDKNSGKMMFGMSGGQAVFNPVGSRQWVKDTAAFGNGWEAHGIWGSGDPNRIRGYWHDQDTTGDNNQLREMSDVYDIEAPLNKWYKYTCRVVINTPGKNDGIYEVYLGDTLVGKVDTVKWRSFAQSDNIKWKINSLFVTYFFGGSGCDYAADGDQWIYFDDFVAYYYLPSANSYIEGTRSYGDEIPGIETSTNDIYPEVTDVLFDSIYTTYIDTINASDWGAAIPPYSLTPVTKEIRVDTANFRFEFLMFEDGYSNYSAYGDYSMWVKIYEGIGETKTQRYYFGNPGDGGDNPPNPSINSIYTIQDSLITIEYQTGYNYSKGWQLAYDFEKEGVSTPGTTCNPSYKETGIDTTFVNFTNTLNASGYVNVTGEVDGSEFTLDDGAKLKIVGSGWNKADNGETTTIFDQNASQSYWFNNLATNYFDVINNVYDTIKIFGSRSSISGLTTDYHFLNETRVQTQNVGQNTDDLTVYYIGNYDSLRIGWQSGISNYGYINALMLLKVGSEGHDTNSTDINLVNWYKKCGISIPENLVGIEKDNYISYVCEIVDSINAVAFTLSKPSSVSIDVRKDNEEGTLLGNGAFGAVGVNDTLSLSDTRRAGIDTLFFIFNSAINSISNIDLVYKNQFTPSPPPPPRDTILLSDTIMATQIDSVKGCWLDALYETTDTVVTSIDSSDYWFWFNVDFESGIDTLEMAYIAHPDYLGDFEIWIDDIPNGESGTKIADYTTISTGGWYTFGIMEIPLNETVSGVHDLSFLSNQFAGGHFYKLNKKETITEVETPLPNADFFAIKTIGGSPFTVQFSNSSDGLATNYEWIFGDGETVTTQSVSDIIHSYDSAGIYTVTLNAVNETGTIETSKTDYIEVKPIQENEGKPPTINGNVIILDDGRILEL